MELSGPRTVTVFHSPLNKFYGWGHLTLPPGSAVPPSFSGGNELLFHVSAGQLLVMVGPAIGESTEITVERGGMVQVRPGNYFSLANTSPTCFAKAEFWHAKRNQ
jgi:mannose-6-phosphate isomerase-like protein (cupin superfamily)